MKRTMSFYFPDFKVADGKVTFTDYGKIRCLSIIIRSGRQAIRYKNKVYYID